MSNKNGVSSKQIRAARALLDWSQDDLANASGLSIATIRKLELGHISPRGKTTIQIQNAFEGAGLEFIDPNGVRQRPEGIIIYEGEEGAKGFYNDVYEVANKFGGDIVTVCRDADTIFKHVLKEYMHVHIARMTALMDKASVKVILTESKTSTPGEAYAEYRYLSQNLVNSVPFYVYGDRCAFRLLNRDISPRYIVIHSIELADTLRQQFFSLWDKAVPVSAPSRIAAQKTKKKREK